MNNNPVVFVDPTGHMADRGGGASSMGEDWWNKRADNSSKTPKLKFDSTLGENASKEPLDNHKNIQSIKSSKPPNVVGIILGGVVTLVGVAGFTIGIGVAFHDPPVGLLLASGSAFVTALGAEIVYRSLGDLRPPSWPDSLLNISGLR
jgi:hypothetical protein